MESRLGLELARVSDTLAADGYSLRLSSFSEGVACVQVEATSEACIDCLMPREMLEGILLNELGSAEPGLQTVRVLMPPAEA